MKKLAIAFGMFITSTFTLTAQVTPKLAIKAGVNIADIKVEGLDNDVTDNRIGLHAGLAAHIHLGQQFAFAPELQYSQEGAKYSDNNATTTLKLDYVNLPLMIQYMFNNGFRLEAGPQFGILVNSKWDADGGNDLDADDDFKTPNVGLGFGLNYLSTSGLGVGARYNLGLSNIAEEGNGEIKTRNIQVSLFYMFDNNHKAKTTNRR
jgi:hypothetical protein